MNERICIQYAKYYLAVHMIKMCGCADPFYCAICLNRSACGLSTTLDACSLRRCLWCVERVDTGTRHTGHSCGDVLITLKYSRRRGIMLTSYWRLTKEHNTARPKSAHMPGRHTVTPFKRLTTLYRARMIRDVYSRHRVSIFYLPSNLRTLEDG